jgi:hypothetical protein
MDMRHQSVSDDLGVGQQGWAASDSPTLGYLSRNLFPRLNSSFGCFWPQKDVKEKERNNGRLAAAIALQAGRVTNADTEYHRHIGGTGRKSPMFPVSAITAARWPVTRLGNS